MKIIDCRAKATTPEKERLLIIKAATQLAHLLLMSVNTRTLQTQYQTQTLKIHLLKNGLKALKQELLTNPVRLKLLTNFHHSLLKLIARTASFQKHHCPHASIIKLPTLMVRSWTHPTRTTVLEVCRHTNKLHSNH